MCIALPAWPRIPGLLRGAAGASTCLHRPLLLVMCIHLLVLAQLRACMQRKASSLHGLQLADHLVQSVPAALPACTGTDHSRNHCCPPCLQVATKSTFFQQPDFYGVDLTALHAPATAGYFGQARLLQRPLCDLVSRGLAHAMARACLLPCVTCAIAAGRLGKRVVMLPVRCHKQQAWKAHQTSTQLPAWNWQSAASTDPVPHIMPSLGMDAWPHIMLSTPAFSELAFVVCSSLQVVVDQIPPNVLVSNCVSKTFDFLAITEQVRSPSQTLSCRLHTRQRTARHPAHCCPFAVCPAWKGESLS